MMQIHDTDLRQRLRQWAPPAVSMIALSRALVRDRYQFLTRKTEPLVRNTKGGVASEFALTLPVLLIFMVGIIETANYYFLSSALENAVLHASRFGITGNEEEDTPREQLVRSVILKQTFGRIKREDLNIETLVYENFADIDQPEPYVDENDSGTYDFGEPYSDVNGNGQWDPDVGEVGLGGAGDIVLYRVSYAAPSLTGLFTWDQILPLEATVAVRNEPF